METSDDELGRLFEEIRDARRPKLEDVLEVVGPAFAQLSINVVPVTSGPTSWIWEDMEMRELGMPRFYIISTTPTAGLEGYPILTIRQAYSLRFDTWITTTNLVIGPGPEEITRSVVMSMANHSGAFAGVKYTSGVIASNRNSPLSGMIAAKRLLEASPPSISEDEAVDEIEALGIQLDRPDIGRVLN